MFNWIYSTQSSHNSTMFRILFYRHIKKGVIYKKNGWKYRHKIVQHTHTYLAPILLHSRKSTLVSSEVYLNKQVTNIMIWEIYLWESQLMKRPGIKGWFAVSFDFISIHFIQSRSADVLVPSGVESRLALRTTRWIHYSTLFILLHFTHTCGWGSLSGY